MPDPLPSDASVKPQKPVDLMRFNSDHPLVRMGYDVRFGEPVSASAIADYFRCQRYFFWRYRLGLVSKRSIPQAAEEGTFMHMALQAFILGEDEATIKNMLHSRAALLVDRCIDPSGVAPSGLLEGLLRSADKALAMAKGFRQILGETQPGEFQGRTVTATELVLRGVVEVKTGRTKPAKDAPGTVKIPVIATIDLVTQDCDALTIHDYKRLSGSCVERAKTATFEPQVWMYRVLLSSNDLPVKRFVHWLIQSPTIRQTQKESYADYCKRVVEWYHAKALERPHDPPAAVSQVDYDGPLLTGEQADMLQQVNAAMRRWPHADRFPRTGAPHQCKAWNRQCPYHALCFGSPVLWFDEILANFRQEFRYDQRDAAVEEIN